MWFANIFSHSVACLFILLLVSFAVQKPFGLMASHWFIFVFVACAFGVISKKSLPRFASRRFSPIFFFRSFTGSGVTFNCVIHFDPVFVSGVE